MRTLGPGRAQPARPDETARIRSQGQREFQVRVKPISPAVLGAMDRLALTIIDMKFRYCRAYGEVRTLEIETM